MTLRRVRVQSVVKWASRIGTGFLWATAYETWGLGAAAVAAAACVIYGMGLDLNHDEGRE